LRCWLKCYWMLKYW